MTPLLFSLSLSLSFLLLSFSPANVVHAGEILPSQETDSPIFYYGFINNERYQHYMPSKSSNIQRDRDLINLSCNKGYTVSVKKASIRDLNEEENDYTKMAQEMCSKKEQCKIDVRKFKRNTQNNQIDLTSELIVEYICMSANTHFTLTSSQKNLYDGNTFHQGVTQKYLVVRDQSQACAQNGKDVMKFSSISKALETCTRDNCPSGSVLQRGTLVKHMWKGNTHKTVHNAYKGYPAHNVHKDMMLLFPFYQDLVEKKNNITYINPILFYTHGYATFLNYMSICDHVIKSAPHNLSMAKSVDVCSHLDCDYFTKSNRN